MILSDIRYCFINSFIDKPGQLVGLTTSVLSCDTMKMSWQQPLFDERGGSLTYCISLPHQRNITSNNHYDITGLSCGNSYNISVTSLLCEVEESVPNVISGIFTVGKSFTIYY